MRTLTIVDTSNTEISFLLPGDWNELTSSQLLFLIELVNKKISAEEIKIKMLLFCLKGRVMKRNIDLSFNIKLGKKRIDLSAEELHTIAEIFNYLFIGEKDDIRINPLLVNNPFPSIRIGWVKLYGPADGLTNYNYQQFMELQIAQSEAGNSPKELDYFLSLMYRHKNGKRSKLFRLIPARKKIAILWFYFGCMNFLQEKFPLPFSGESSGNVVDGQMRIIDALAKNDVTKKNDVLKSDLYQAFYTMQIAAEEAEKLNDKLQ